MYSKPASISWVCQLLCGLRLQYRSQHSISNKYQVYSRGSQEARQGSKRQPSVARIRPAPQRTDDQKEVNMKASALKNPSRLLVATLFTVLVATIVSTPAYAQSTTASGVITLYTNGWSQDSVRVQTNAPLVNPFGCPNTDGYITNPSDPGNHTFQTALLEAYRTRLIYGRGFVQITVSNTACYLGWPKIIGVTLHP